MALFDRLRGVRDRVAPRLRGGTPLVRLATLSGGALRAYLRFRGAVEAGIGAEAAELYGQVVVAVAERDGELARMVAGTLPDQLARVASEQRPLYAEVLREVVGVRLEAVPLLIRTLPELIPSMPEEALRPFVAQGLALHAISPHKAESFLRRESTVGQAAARSLHKGLALSEVQRTLTLYARAHCGEDVQVRAGRGRAFSDGHHIYLPEVVDHFGDERDFLVLKVQTAIAAGYLEFGSFNLDLDALGGSFPDRLPGENEVERFLRSFSNRSLARDLFQILEDARVEARIGAMYPGVARDIARVGPTLRGDRPEPKGGSARAVESLARRSWGLPELPLDAREQRAIAPFAEALDRVRALEVADVAREVTRSYAAVEALMRHTADEPPRLDGDGAGEGDGRRNRKNRPREREAAPGPAPYESLAASPLQPRIAPEEAGADERRVEAEAQRILDEMRRQGEQADRGEARRRVKEAERRAEERMAMEAMLDRQGPQGGGAVVEGKEAEDAPARSPSGPQLDLDVAAQGRAFFYREWDSTIEDYKPRWVLVREQLLKEGGREYVDAVMQRHGALIDQLRRRFEALRPQGLVRVRNLPDGDDLDIDRVVERHVARRAGHEANDRLYVKRHREQRDVVVAFLLDMSSSTNESADGTSRRIIDVEKEALIVAAEALDALGDPFAVWGFSGYGRDHVSFYVAKEFDEPWGERARERVGRMSFKMENRDGAAIRHATARLLAQPARQRILLLLSDGKPLDCGCDHYFDRYAQEDTRVALREARKLGIHPFCITVDPTGPQYLAKMYGDVAYTVIDRVEMLPSRLVNVYRRLAT